MRKVVLVVAASQMASFNQCCAAPKDRAARTPPVDTAHCQPGAALKQHIDSALQCTPLQVGQRVESAAAPAASDASGLRAAQDATRARPPASAAFKRRRDVPAAAVRSAHRSAPMTSEAAVPKCVPPSARAADSGARPRESPPAAPAAGHARKRRCAGRSAEFGTPPGQRAAAACAPHGTGTIPCVARMLDKNG